MADQHRSASVPRLLFLASIALAAVPPVLAALMVAHCHCLGLAEALPFAALNAPAGVALYIVGRRDRNNVVAYWTAAGAMIGVILAALLDALTPGGGDMAAIGNIFWTLVAPVLGMVAAVAGWALSSRLGAGLDRTSERWLAFLIFAVAVAIPSIGFGHLAWSCDSRRCANAWTSPFPPPP